MCINMTGPCKMCNDKYHDSLLEHSHRWKGNGVVATPGGTDDVASSIFCETCGLIKIVKH